VDGGTDNDGKTYVKRARKKREARISGVGEKKPIPTMKASAHYFQIRFKRVVGGKGRKTGGKKVERNAKRTIPAGEYG